MTACARCYDHPPCPVHGVTLAADGSVLASVEPGRYGQPDRRRYDLPEVLRTPSAAPPSTCPDCGGRGWRRQVGAFACACLAGQLHMLTARVAALEAEREHDNG